jgi:hypothetical protein
MKIEVIIIGEMEFPEYMLDFVSEMIDKNFVKEMPLISEPPMTLRYKHIQRNVRYSIKED